MTKNNLKLVYVKYLAKETELSYKYALYFSENPDIVWGRDWDYYCPSSCEDLTPDSTTYNKNVFFTTTYKLKLAQETSCYPMSYVIDGIIALSWINLDELDEYPDNGRMVLHFGDSFDKVKEILSKFEINI